MIRDPRNRHPLLNKAQEELFEMEGLFDDVRDNLAGNKPSDAQIVAAIDQLQTIAVHAIRAIAFASTFGTEKAIVAALTTKLDIDEAKNRFLPTFRRLNENFEGVD